MNKKYIALAMALYYVSTIAPIGENKIKLLVVKLQRQLHPQIYKDYKGLFNSGARVWQLHMTKPRILN